MTDDTKKSGKQNYQSDDAFSGLDEESMLTGLDDMEDEEEGSGSSIRGNQGFASMSKAKQREIASKGGKAAHVAGTAHEWNSIEAAEAGRRGGQKKAA